MHYGREDNRGPILKPSGRDPIIIILFTTGFKQALAVKKVEELHVLEGREARCSSFNQGREPGGNTTIVCDFYQCDHRPFQPLSISALIGSHLNYTAWIQRHLK